jgi:hypothetical protein
MLNGSTGRVHESNYKDMSKLFWHEREIYKPKKDFSLQIISCDSDSDDKAGKSEGPRTYKRPVHLNLRVGCNGRTS